jgi:hypothetical protein
MSTLHKVLRVCVGVAMLYASSVATAQQQTTIGPFSRCDVSLPVSPVAIATGDFDNDGYADVAVLGNNELVILLMNKDALSAGRCDAAVQQQSTVSLAPASVVVTAGYLNGNNTDLVVGGQLGIRILTGDGHGGFTATDLSTASSVHAVAIADLNGNGASDIIVGGNSGVTVFYSASKPETAVGTTDSEVDFLPVEDFNQDGLRDVVAGSTLSSTGWLFLQQRSSGSSPPSFDPQQFSTGSESPTALGAGLFDQDQYPDLAITSAGELTVFTNRLGTMSPPPFSSVTPAAQTGAAPLALAVNRADLVQGPDPTYVAVANHDDGTVSLFTTSTEGVPTEVLDLCGADTINGRCSTGAGPRAVALANIDGDNRNDVITANESDQSITLLLSTHPTISTPVATQTSTVTPTPIATTTPGGECCTAHSGPQCDNSSCSTCVCGLLPSCCSDTWSERCVGLANGEEDSGCSSDCLCGVATATPTETATGTATDTETPTSTPTPTGTLPTSTPTPTPTPTSTPTLIPTSTPSPTLTPTRTPTATPLPTVTPTPGPQCIAGVCISGSGCHIGGNAGPTAASGCWGLPALMLWLWRRRPQRQTP